MWNVARNRVNFSLLNTVKNACRSFFFPFSLFLSLVLHLHSCVWLETGVQLGFCYPLDNVLCDFGAQFRQWRCCKTPSPQKKQTRNYCRKMSNRITANNTTKKCCARQWDAPSTNSQHKTAAMHRCSLCQQIKQHLMPLTVTESLTKSKMK